MEALSQVLDQHRDSKALLSVISVRTAACCLARHKFLFINKHTKYVLASSAINKLGCHPAFCRRRSCNSDRKKLFFQSIYLAVFDYGFLASDALWSCRLLRLFRRNLLPPSWGSVSCKPDYAWVCLSSLLWYIIYLFHRRISLHLVFFYHGRMASCKLLSSTRFEILMAMKMSMLCEELRTWTWKD